MAVREYIGARYVPIFDGQWDNTKAYEPLTVVQYEGNSYTSRQFVPIGTAITDGNFWVETGNYNAQIEAYKQEVLTFNNRIEANSDAIAAFNSELSEFEENTNTSINSLIKAKTYINVIEKGIINDGETDNFETLQALIDDVFNAGGGTLYFPAGTYNISNTLVIPDNIRITGDGAATIIYGKGSIWHYFGVVLAIVGNNVVIDNIFGSYDEYDANFKTSGSNFGFIGICSYTFTSLKAYIKKESTNLEQRITKGIVIDNFWSNTHYPLQTESINVYDVIYSNVYAPNGCVSFQINQNYFSSRFIAKNIICGFFRCLETSNDNNASSYDLSNIICSAFYCNAKGANVSDIYIDYYDSNVINKWIAAGSYKNGYLCAFANCNVSNVTLNLHNYTIALSIAKLFVAAATHNVNISNIQFINCTDNVNKNISFQEFNSFIIYGTNIDFTKCDSTIPAEISMHGVNCKFGNINTSLSNIRSNEYCRNLSYLLKANTTNLPSPSKFADYENYYHLYKDYFDFFSAIKFTPITLDSSTPNLQIFTFESDVMKPVRKHTIAGWIYDETNSRYSNAIFTINTDGIYLTASSAINISRIILGGRVQMV